MKSIRIRKHWLVIFCDIGGGRRGGKWTISWVKKDPRRKSSMTYYFGFEDFQLTGNSSMKRHLIKCPREKWDKGIAPCGIPISHYVKEKNGKMIPTGLPFIDERDNSEELCEFCRSVAMDEHIVEKERKSLPYWEVKYEYRV